MTRNTALLLLAVAAVWATSLWAGFVFDDWADVVDNTAAQAATFIERLATTVRPLLKASYALQDWLHGAWAPGFHAGNVLLHLGACAVAFALLRRLASERVALFATALWALHPALTASVTQVAGRSAVLSGLLLLGSLALVIGPRTAARMTAAGLLAFLAPLARETALVLPLLLLWWQLTLGRGESFKPLLAVFLGTALAAAVILLLPRHRELIDYSLDARGPLDALRGNVVAIPAILRFLVMPWDLSIDPAQPRPWGWGDWPTLFSLAGLGATALAAIVLRRRQPLVAFALGWTLLCFLPSNSLIWRSDPVALRPLYLAALGPALLLALFLAHRRRALLLATLLVALLSAMTVQRNLLHADPVALWQDAVEEAPFKARPWTSLGLALLDTEDFRNAEQALCNGLQLEPGNQAARQGLKRLAALTGEPLQLCTLP